MSVKIISKLAFIVIILLCTYSYTSAQKNKYAEDLRIYKEACKIDHEPEIIRKKDTGILAYCQIFFKKRSENDSIVIYNTDNEEIIELITQCVRKIRFTKKYRRQSSLVIPYIFKNGDEYKNIYIKLSVSAINLSVLYGKLGSTHINSLIFIRPVIIVGFGERPPIR